MGPKVLILDCSGLQSRLGIPVILALGIVKDPAYNMALGSSVRRYCKAHSALLLLSTSPQAL
jgi:hypothetical protein